VSTKYSDDTLQTIADTREPIFTQALRTSMNKEHALQAIDIVLVAIDIVLVDTSAFLDNPDAKSARGLHEGMTTARAIVVASMEHDMTDKDTPTHTAATETDLTDKNTDPDYAKVDWWFQFHSPADHPEGQTEAVAKYLRIREAGRDFARVILAECPPSADRTHAIRLIRSAVHFANASVACEGK